METPGKVETAKHPRKRPYLLDLRATLIEPPRMGANPPPAQITLPDGTLAISRQSALNQILSKALICKVTLDTTERDHGGWSAYVRAARLRIRWQRRRLPR